MSRDYSWGSATDNDSTVRQRRPRRQRRPTAEEEHREEAKETDVSPSKNILHVTASGSTCSRRQVGLSCVYLDWFKMFTIISIKY